MAKQSSRTTHLTNTGGDRMTIHEDGATVTTTVNGKTISTAPTGDGHGKPAQVMQRQGEGWTPAFD